MCRSLSGGMWRGILKALEDPDDARAPGRPRAFGGGKGLGEASRRS